MKISELIEKLQHLADLHGDLPVEDKAGAEIATVTVVETDTTEAVAVQVSS